MGYTFLLQETCTLFLQNDWEEGALFRVFSSRKSAPSARKTDSKNIFRPASRSHVCHKQTNESTSVKFTLKCTVRLSFKTSIEQRLLDAVYVYARENLAKVHIYIQAPVVTKIVRDQGRVQAYGHGQTLYMVRHRTDFQTLDTDCISCPISVQCLSLLYQRPPDPLIESHVREFPSSGSWPTAAASWACAWVSPSSPSSRFSTISRR